MARKRTLLLVFLGLLILALAVPVVRGLRERWRLTECLHHAKTIGLACKLYANDHSGKYPPGLADLVPNYLPDGAMFVCPLASGTATPGYDYFGGTDTDPANRVLVRGRFADSHGQRVIVQVDASGRVVRDPLPSAPR